MSYAEKFAAIFDGLQEAYGTYRVDRKNANGKNTGKATVHREPRTINLWENHLSGDGDALGIIPINADNMVRWGCLDIDQYPLDHSALVKKIRALKIPMIVFRSKSGGAHCYFFSTEWMSAKDMQETLHHVGAALGYGDVEIFPKQIKLHLQRGDVGNFLNLPYFDHENGLRYAIQNDGSAATLEEFFELYEKFVQTPEQLLALTVDTDEVQPIKDGPPCLQHLCAQKISEGSRNNGLFNIGVYLRKAFSDSWENEILKYNNDCIDPPLPLNEVNTVARQLNKQDYAYKCKDAPINAFCNAQLCRTRKYGIEAAASGAIIANLRKYNSQPPVWFLDVNSEPVELDTDTFLNQTIFQKACVEQLNFMPRSLTRQAWENRITGLLSEMNENDDSIIEVSEDASTSGRFYDHLEEWCTNLQQASDRDEILLRRPYTDEEHRLILFRLRDFENHLKKVKFTEFKTHKIAQRLRDLNGKSTVVKIKGKPVRVWAIPSYETRPVELDTPDFKPAEDPPF